MEDRKIVYLVPIEGSGLLLFTAHLEAAPYDDVWVRREAVVVGRLCCRAMIAPTSGDWRL